MAEITRPLAALEEILRLFAALGVPPTGVAPSALPVRSRVKVVDKKEIPTLVTVADFFGSVNWDGKAPVETPTAAEATTLEDSEAVPDEFMISPALLAIIPQTPVGKFFGSIDWTGASMALPPAPAVTAPSPVAVVAAPVAAEAGETSKEEKKVSAEEKNAGKFFEGFDWD